MWLVLLAVKHGCCRYPSPNAVFGRCQQHRGQRSARSRCMGRSRAVGLTSLLQNGDTLQYLRNDGTLGAAQRFSAALSNPRDQRNIPDSRFTFSGTAEASSTLEGVEVLIRNPLDFGGVQASGAFGPVASYFRLPGNNVGTGSNWTYQSPQLTAGTTTCSSESLIHWASERLNERRFSSAQMETICPKRRSTMQLASNKASTVSS